MTVLAYILGVAWCAALLVLAAAKVWLRIETYKYRRLLDSMIEDVDLGGNLPTGVVLLTGQSKWYSPTLDKCDACGAQFKVRRSELPERPENGGGLHKYPCPECGVPQYVHPR